METSTSTTIPTWTLGDRMQKARKTAGIGSTEMGDRLGITRTTVANYESGRHRVPHVVLIVWAQETGVPMEWLLAGEVTGGYLLVA